MKSQAEVGKLNFQIITGNLDLPSWPYPDPTIPPYGPYNPATPKPEKVLKDYLKHIFKQK
jgi:hypothetical protein